MSRHDTSEASSSGERTLWIDTDVGFDDLVAISSLGCRQDIDIVLVTTVGGIQSNPLNSANFVQAELVPTTSTVIPGLVPRAIIQDEDNDSVPNWLQNTREKLKCLQSEGTLENSLVGSNRLDTQQGQNHLIQLLTSREDNSVDLLCLGPLTNIAYCLDSTIIQDLMNSKLRQIWIMGGNNPSISSEAEFNFATDALATKKVLECPVLKDRIHILPLQTCEVENPENSMSIEDTWNGLINLATSKEPTTTNKDHSILQRVFQASPDFSSVKYDAICAFAYYQPDQVTMEQMEIRVNSTSGALTPVPASEKDLGLRHQFISNFPLNGQNGLFQWIQEATE